MESNSLEDKPENHAEKVEYVERMENRNWIEHIVEKVVENYCGREVVIWGKYEVGDKIKEKLQQIHEIKVAFYVDNDVLKIDEDEVRSPERLWGKSDKYYVIIPLSFHQGIKGKLTGGGYTKHKDYYYFCDCILHQEEDYYEDAHGNKIIGKYKGLKFAFSGFDSVIEIGENVQFMNSSIYIHNGVKIFIGSNTKIQNTTIDMDDHAEIVFGENVTINRAAICKTSWEIKENSKVAIGNECLFEAGTIWVDFDASVIIGKGVYISHNYKFLVYKNNSIMIGDDCMLSSHVSMRSHDAHSIFDIETGKNINSTCDIRKKRKIYIGNHVWIGENAYILYNTQIGDGSIIGAMSLVKSKIPNNCIAAGVPARLVKKNIAWCTEDGAEDMVECGSEYINYTN